MAPVQFSPQKLVLVAAAAFTIVLVARSSVWCGNEQPLYISALRAVGAASTASAPSKRSYAAPIDDVLKGCGDICRIDMPGSPGKFFDFIAKKQVDCDALMTNAAIDAAMLEAEPPTTFPEHLAATFTFGGRIPVRSYLGEGRVFNQRYLGGTAMRSNWTRELVDDWSAKCKRGELGGTYGVGPTNALRDALAHANVGGGRVLVVGSEIPWVEACLLAKGAKEVVTLEYGAITSTHPQVSTITPAQARSRAKELRETFDAVVSFSSLEHSGLGRYGDAMNPHGDRQATARAWCMTRPGGRMVAGLPVEPDGSSDVIHYNAHRSYGKLQLPHMFANWHQLWSGDASAPPLTHHIWVVEKM